MRARAIVLVAVLALICAASVQAAPTARADIYDCLELTSGGGGGGHISSTVWDSLGLTRDQKRAIQGIVIEYHGVKHQPMNFHGLGLTPAQIQAIRLAVTGADASVVAHPAGWPCKPFVNQARVIEWVKEDLIQNGFHPNVTVVASSPRQLRIDGVLDGVALFGTVARSGVSEITISLTSVTPRWGRSYTFDVGFTA